MMDPLDKPTELTPEDIDKFVKDLENGDYDIKPRPCFTCSKSHFPNYGYGTGECDECYFSRFSKEERRKFFQTIIDEMK